MHPHQLNRFNEICASSHKRKLSNEVSEAPQKQAKQQKVDVMLAACPRLKGKHTYDVLAAKLEDIHTDYDIQAKIVMTTTNSGSNFVKAFSVLGATANAEQPEASDEVVFEDVSEELTKAEDSLEYHLPPDLRCAAHSLNLVSTVDAERAEENPVYKRLSRASFASASHSGTNRPTLPRRQKLLRMNVVLYY